VIYRLSTVPAQLLRVQAGALSPGFPADIVIFDPDAVWRVEPDALKSKSANTPLIGMNLRGRAVRTLVDGEVRFDS
jgi:dihydroorotase